MYGSLYGCESWTIKKAKCQRIDAFELWYCRRLQFDSWVGSSPGEETGYPFQFSWNSLVAQTVNNLPAMWETWVRSLGWEDLEKGPATHSSILSGESHGPYSPWGHKESDATE